MKTVTVSVDFQCDVCQSESATTSGAKPSGWKEIAHKGGSLLNPVTKRINVGPACAASSDSDILIAIRNLALRSI